MSGVTTQTITQKGWIPRDIYTSHSDRAERARQATDALCKGCNQKDSQTSNWWITWLILIGNVRDAISAVALFAIAVLLLYVKKALAATTLLSGNH